MPLSQFIFIYITCCGLCVLSQSSKCNPLICMNYFSKLFIQEDERTSCSKFSKLENCLRVCLESHSNSRYFFENLKLVRSQICHEESEGSLDGFFGNQCLRKRKFSTLNCIYNASHMFSYNEDQNLTNCRKALEAESCLNEFLAPCGEKVESRSSYFVSKFFERSRKMSCVGYSLNSVWDFPVYWHFTGLAELAECFDNHNRKLESCLPEKWTNIPKFVDSELCQAYNEYLNCIHDLVDENCAEGNSLTFNRSMRSSLELLVPFCYEDRPSDLNGHWPETRTTTDRASALKAVDGPDPDHHDGNGDKPSEVIILHFWGVHHDDSSASKINSSYLYTLLFSMACVLVVHLRCLL